MTPLLPIMILGLALFMCCMQVADIMMHFTDAQPAQPEAVEPKRKSSTDWSRIMEETKLEKGGKCK